MKIKFKNRLIRKLLKLFDTNKRNFYIARKFNKRFTPILSNRFPLMLIIETTNRCNLSCSHCPHKEIIRNENYSVGDMDINLFKRIIDEAVQYKNIIIRPFADGEPLLHPQIIEMIKYSSDRNLHIWLNTNGILLNEKMRFELLEAGCNELEVSIDAATESTYKNIRGNDNFNKVVENVIEYAKLKKRYKKNFILEVSFILSNDNFKEKQSFIKFWRNKVDKVRIRYFHQHTGLIKDDKRVVAYDKSKRFPCSQLWTRTYITHSGKIRFCENDWTNKGIIGDIKNETIKEIWSGDKYEEIRNYHINGNYQKIPLCFNCTDYCNDNW